MNKQTQAISSTLITPKNWCKICLIAIGVATPSCWGPFAAQGYPSGAGALEKFDGAARAAVPPQLKIWLMLLLGTFAASIVFVWKYPVARVALIGLLAAFFAGPKLVGAFGLPVLGGAIALSHIVFWTPVLIVLLWKRPFLDSETWLPYRIWSGLLLLVIIGSFVFDVRDAWIYINHVSSLKA